MAENQWEAGVITYPLQVELFHPTYSWIRGPLCRGTIFSDDEASVPVFFFHENMGIVYLQEVWG